MIGTLYCSKGIFEFGINQLIKALTPLKDKLGTDTWYYTKRCFLSLIEKVLKKQFKIDDKFYQKIIAFLDLAFSTGKQIVTVVYM